MYGKNIWEKRLLASFAILIFAFAGVAMAFGFQGMSGTNNLTKTVGIGSDIGEAYGFNGTGAHPVWQAATITGTGATSTTVKLNFTAGFNVTNIVVFQKNPLYDVQGILNQSLFVNFINIKTSVMNKSGIAEKNTFNLSLVATVFGRQINDTSMTAISDKTVIAADSYSTQVLYSNSVNNLNKSEKMSLFGLGAANYADYGTIVINVNSAGVGSGNNFIISLTQTYSSPNGQVNLVNAWTDIYAAVMLVAVGLIVLGMPRMKGGK